MNVELPHKQIGVAVIWNQTGQILIDRRKASGTMGGLWEFPGGKIELGETVAECIVREIKEELAIEITVGEHLISIDHTYPTFHLKLVVHHCQYISGVPQPIESDEIRWVNVCDLNNYQFPAANIAIINVLTKQFDSTSNPGSFNSPIAAAVTNQWTIAHQEIIDS